MASISSSGKKRKTSEEWKAEIEEKKKRLGTEKILVIAKEPGFYEEHKKPGCYPFMVEKWRFSETWMEKVENEQEAVRRSQQAEAEYLGTVKTSGGVLEKEYI